MNAIIPFQGNAQGHFADNGMDRLFWEVLRGYASEKTTVYHPRTWKTNVKNLAAQLERARVKHLLLVGYSHGQSAIMALSRMAPEYGVKTIQVILCDPIYRNPLLPRWAWAQVLSARSLTPWAKIRVPRSIHRVDSCRQEVDWPRGHVLIPDDPAATTIERPIIIESPHRQIHWHHAWHSMVKRVADEWVNPPKAIPA